MEFTATLDAVLGTVWRERANKPPCAVGIILDKFGGSRIIVTEEDSFQQHVNPQRDELLWIVPDPKGGSGNWNIMEAWAAEYDHWPIVVQTAELYLKWWLETRNDPDALKHPTIAAYCKRVTEGQQHSLHLGDGVP